MFIQIQETGTLLYRPQKQFIIIIDESKRQERHLAESIGLSEYLQNLKESWGSYRL